MLKRGVKSTEKAEQSQSSCLSWIWCQAQSLSVGDGEGKMNAGGAADLPLPLTEVHIRPPRLHCHHDLQEKVWKSWRKRSHGSGASAHLLPTPVTDLLDLQTPAWAVTGPALSGPSGSGHSYHSTSIFHITADASCVRGQPSPETHRRKELWEPSLSPAGLQSHHIAALRLCRRQRCHPSPRPALFPALLLLLPPEHRQSEVCHLS